MEREGASLNARSLCWQAKNLPPGGLFKLDPYVKLTVGFWKRSTAVSKSGDASPSWHQELLL